MSGAASVLAGPAPATAQRRGSARVLPGFNLTLGYTLLYLSVIVLIPLSALLLKTFSMSWADFWSAVTSPRVMASYRLTFGASLLAASVNVVFGLLVAWVLVRYRFPGKKIVDALVDLPFALPTAVAGIALTALLAGNGWVGQWFEPLGIRQTFARVILPTILPALLTGFALAFARAVGEYGSVVFIAGNIPMVSEITPLIIIGRLEQYDYTGATAVATVMLAISFVLLLLINALQGWQRRRAAGNSQ